MKKLGTGVSFSCALFLILSISSGCASGGVPAPANPGVPIITPGGALLLPGQTVQFTASLSGVPFNGGTWELTATGGATGSITSAGLYTSPMDNVPTSVTVVLHDLAHQTFSAPATIRFFQSGSMQPGTVTSSGNPLVASYNIMAPQGSTVSVQFGTTTAYGLNTWNQPAPDGGGLLNVLVAGMRSASTYHMLATIHLPDGTDVPDTDKTFTTGAIPAGLLPNLTIKQTPGLTPSGGVEMLSLFEEASQEQLTAVITDLQGNVIWYYPIQPSSTFPMKPLPNGHILILVGAQNTVQEIDLAGNVISQVTLTQVQASLNAQGYNYPPLNGAHHDMLKLPNGHLIMLCSFIETVSSLPPGNQSVVADILVDWDPVRQSVVWVWSTTDHMDLSHAPFGTADWTHGNALVYSADDGNLIFSMRNQDWVIKINYQDGAGDGKILWHLGNGGDFALVGGQAPLEWNYGQHYPVILSPNSSGIFTLMLFNNGTNRLVDTNNDVCGAPGLTACYSSVPVFQLNESAKTAEIQEELNLSPDYTLCCGSTNFLSNGDWEYDVALDVNTPNVSYIQEMTHEQNPQLVWQMNITGQLAYRGFRIPSLYPGIEWSQEAIAAANATPPKAGTASTKH